MNLNSDTQILDHEFVFWFGDLNYRIDDSVSKEDVFKHIESKNISYLRQNDQLNIERSNGRVFQGFVEEELNFYPTYKFQPGTDLYEQRPEKKLRAPAFCDRILWRTKNNPSSVRISSYLSSKLLPSDHKPVLAVFSTDVKEIVAEKERSVYNELMKKLDQSNTVESIILAEISGLQIDLLDVKYNVPTVSDITIKNIGNTTIYWHFIPKVEESLFSKKWVYLDITSGLLLPGEITIISVKVLIDKKTAQSLNQAKETLDDIIQLRIENYNDFFVNIHAKYLRSCFGVSLEELVHTMVPIRNTPMPTLPYSSKAVMPQTAATSPKLGIPKELWRLVDALWTGDCIREKDLFAFEAAVTELEQICDCLDEGKCFPKCSPHALSQTLVSWIEALPNQLLPSRLYPTSEIESNQLRNWSRKFLESLPPLNYTVFVYIISFFREVLAQAEYNRYSICTSFIILNIISSHVYFLFLRSTPLRLAEVCVGCMLPSPLDPELTKDEKERRIGKQQIMLPVIMHFLSSTSI